MTNQEADLIAAGKLDDSAEEPPEAFARTRADAWTVMRDLRKVVLLASPLKGLIGLFIGLYVVASFVQMVALVCLNTGFSVMGTVGDPAAELSRWSVLLVSGLGIAAEHHWLFFFSAFLLMSVGAAGLDHLGWMIRLKLLASYEAEQTANGLKLACSVDPRGNLNMGLRDMVMAVRGDCKAMRGALQMLLMMLVSVVRIIFPVYYIFTIDAGMSALGLSILLIGFLPIIFLARKSGSMSLERQDLAIEAGCQVSTMLSNLQHSNSYVGTTDQAIRDIRSAVMKQHVLWRRQYEIRSLSQKVPQMFALLGTYVLIIWGVTKIRAGVLSWGELMTFTLSARLVFQPFNAIGNLWAKTAEFYPRARRHLQFMRMLKEAARPTDEKKPLLERVESITVRGLRLSGTDAEPSEPLDFTLRRGEILTIVDPSIHSGNRLLQYLTGTRTVETGVVLLNEFSVNELDYSSIVDVYQDLEHATAMSGRMIDCVQELQPATTREEFEQFAIAVLGDRYLAWMPDGVDTVVFPQQKSEPTVTGRYAIIELFDLHRRHRNLVMVHFSSFGNLERREAVLGYFSRFRDQLITVWVDTIPRDALGAQTIAVFREGQFAGLGDSNWFRKTFRDWEKINGNVKHNGSEQMGFAEIEAMECEMVG